MYSIFAARPASALLIHEFPALSVSLVVAEQFFKLHSFTLECLAFLATWYGVSWILHLVFPQKEKAA